MVTPTDCLRFRLATLSDISQLSAIRLAVRENALSHPGRITLAMYEDYLTRKGRGWLCERGHEVLGFSVACADEASIWALFIHPDHEGQGIGKTLLAMAIAWLQSLGKTEARLSTAPETRADRLYQSQGWQRGETIDGEVHYTLALRHV